MLTNELVKNKQDIQALEHYILHTTLSSQAVTKDSLLTLLHLLFFVKDHFFKI